MNDDPRTKAGNGHVKRSDRRKPLAEVCEVKRFEVNQGACRKQLVSLQNLKDPQGGPDIFLASFKVSQPAYIFAEFDKRKGNCKCCEYRQLVIGYVTINGIRQSLHIGPGYISVGADTIEVSDRLVSEEFFQEDGDKRGRPYGHRSDPNEPPIDVYSRPDRATGCVFVGYDAPGGDQLTSGDTYEWQLTFQSAIICVCDQPGRVLAKKFWRVECSGTI